MKKLLDGKKASSMVLGSAMAMIVTLVAGLFFYNFVMNSMQSMAKNYDEQMRQLMLESLNINSTHITALVRNTGKAAANIVNAYVNNAIARLAENVQIAPTSVAAVQILGTYVKGLTYTVKLAGLFGTLIEFQITA